MKAVVINGSYHQQGIIAFLLETFLNGLKSKHEDAEIIQYNLMDIPIEFCRGCGICAQKDGKKIGDCPQVDGKMMKEILKDIIECDILVYASPIYEKAFTAIMKRFIERSMGILYLGNSGPVGRNETKEKKTGVIFLSCSTPSPASYIYGIPNYPSNILSMFCKAAGCKRVKKLVANGVTSREQVNNKYRDSVYKLGVKLSSSLD